MITKLTRYVYLGNRIDETEAGDHLVHVYAPYNESADPRLPIVPDQQVAFDSKLDPRDRPGFVYWVAIEHHNNIPVYRRGGRSADRLPVDVVRTCAALDKSIRFDYYGRTMRMLRNVWKVSDKSLLRALILLTPELRHAAASALEEGPPQS